MQNGRRISCMCLGCDGGSPDAGKAKLRLSRGFPLGLTKMRGPHTR
jgi:hypothetical protein